MAHTKDPTDGDARASGLVRAPLIWTLYLTLGLFSFMLSMIGPMVPYLRDEFSMSYGLAGLHQSAFALGMITMGLAGSAFLKRFGVTRCLWLGMADMLAGLLAMVLARGPAMTLGGVFIMSLGGTIAQASIQMIFASHPSGRGGSYILESNVVASVFTMLVPLVLLAGARSFLGWRVVFPVMLASFLALAGAGVGQTRRHQETRDERADAGGGRLKAAYWRMWLAVFFGVTVEWAIGFWCMTYLLGLPGHSRELAAAGTVLLGLSSVASRFTASRLASRVQPTPLLVIMIGITMAGFPLYWLQATIPLTFIGLALCGFGAASFYPLGVNLALGHAPGNAARAASLVPVASGSAIGLAPFLLGRLADATDMRLALWYIPLGLVVMLAVLLADAAKLKSGR